MMGSDIIEGWRRDRAKGSNTRLGVLIAALMLSACGEVPDNGAGQSTASDEKPKGYYIRKVDLYQESPNDICRAKDKEFLEKLIGRITAVLPHDTAWADFVDFNATEAFDRNGMEAVLRFRAKSESPTPAMLFAVGKFDPASCVVGPLRGGIGAGPYDDRSEIIFKEAGS